MLHSPRMASVPGKRCRPVVLIVLDGLGIAPDGEGNAMTQAKTPTFDLLTTRYPVVTLKASGEEVGLSWGEMGNSEVGHLSVGAGRVYYQTLPRITKAIQEGEFAKNPALLAAIAAARTSKGTLHLIGLVSSGNVHSAETHLHALLELCKKEKCSRVAVHAILDGRDTLYNSAGDFLHTLQDRMKTLGVGKLASMCGRWFAMDRDNRWDRIEKAYRAMVLGEGEQSEDPLQVLRAAYAKEIYDEMIPPTVITDHGKPVATVQPGDAVIFFNFRPDRMRELTRAFVLPALTNFARPALPNITVTTMTEVEQGLPVHVAFPPNLLEHGLAQVVADAGLVQLHIAETEKYAHVTFFFNGTREAPFPHEDRVLIPSPAVATYDLQPEMSAPQISQRVVQEIARDNYDLIIVNIANPDMVAHTGDLPATVQAMEVTDTVVGEMVAATLARGGACVVTADHGNAEEVRNVQTGAVDKEHSTNPVPLWIVGKEFEGKKGISGDAPQGDLSLLPPVGMLADVAPTVLDLLGLEKPDVMTGTSLVPR